MPARILPFMARTPRAPLVTTDPPTHCGERFSGIPVHVWTKDARLNDPCLCGQKVLDCCAAAAVGTDA